MKISDQLRGPPESIGPPRGRISVSIGEDNVEADKILCKFFRDHLVF